MNDNTQSLDSAERAPESVNTKNLNFGRAIEFVKQGAAIAREGWNGKNMLVYLNKGSFDITNNAGVGTIGGVDAELFDVGMEGTVTRMPNLNMQAADGSTVTGWLASQTDILAEDWEVVGGK